MITVVKSVVFDLKSLFSIGMRMKRWFVPNVQPGTQNDSWELQPQFRARRASIILMENVVPRKTAVLLEDNLCASRCNGKGF